MRVFACLFLLAVAMPPARAALTEETRNQIVAGLDALGGELDPEQAESLLKLLTTPQATDGDWRSFFGDYFSSHLFTPTLGDLFETGLAGSEGETQARLLRVSVLAVGTALARNIEALQTRQNERAYAAAATAVAWLSRLSGAADYQTAGPVLTALRQALQVKASAVAPVAGGSRASDPRMAYLGAQLALTLRDFAVLARQQQEVASLLSLKGPGLRFWQSYGVLLLDNGGLDSAQLESLGQLYGAIPSSLHNIGALVVPQSTGLDPSSGLQLRSGQIVFISAVPMTRLTSPTEFPRSSGQPVAAEFTVLAAQQITAAIQAGQFAKRPELGLRLRVILANAGARPKAYLRQTVAPAMFLQSPDTLLPSLAYLWFAHTPALFSSAWYLMRLNQPGAMDQFLLMADLLSGGGAQTPMFMTDPAGRVVRDDAAVFRTVLPPLSGSDKTLLLGDTSVYPAGALYLTGLVVRGERYDFGIGPYGVVSRHSGIWTE